MMDSTSISTADSARKAASQLEHRERQSTLLEFIQADASKEIDSVTRHYHRQDLLDSSTPTTTVNMLHLSKKLVFKQGEGVQNEILAELRELKVGMADIRRHQIEHDASHKRRAGSVKG